MPGFFSPSTWEGTVKAPSLPQCGACGLHKKCYSPRMPPTGAGKRSILFVAEAPGENEDKIGEQLIGDAGKLLRRSLSRLDCNLNDCIKTNAVICRPPKNVIDPKYVECCRPNLISTIKKYQPKVIILLGGSAVQSLVTTEWKKDLHGIGQWVGFTIPSPTYHAWLCPTYHPSFILRTNSDPTLMLMFEQHLKKALELESEPCWPTSVNDLLKEVEIIEDRRQARQRMRELSTKEGVLAFDYETTGLKPEKKEQRIVCCSFCLNGEDTFACPIDAQSIPILSKVLSNPNLRKVASNLKFEERWTRAKVGHPVASWHWDTMLAAHMIDNRPGITSVKFQAYIHLGVADYDSKISPFLYASHANDLNTIDKADLVDLLRYNALDSLIEFKVMEKQKELLEW